jgi:hypothetical protein
VNLVENASQERDDRAWEENLDQAKGFQADNMNPNGHSRVFLASTIPLASDSDGLRSYPWPTLWLGS